MRDQYKQEWLQEITDSSKLLLYTSIKYEHNFESYLQKITCDRWRVALTRLRCSAHALEIEVGRHRQNVPREERLCRLCSMGAVEDEYHFSLVCPALRHLRVKILPRYFCHWPTALKLKLLFTEKYCVVFAKYIVIANQFRQELLN